MFIGGAIYLSQESETVAEVASVDNVSIIEGKQIVSITAKGGYSPRISSAKANIPTILRIETTGTYDCSSALTLPSIKYRKNLPLSGITEIELPPQKPGSTFEGLCSMGMYSFEIAFK